MQEKTLLEVLAKYGNLKLCAFLELRYNILGKNF